MPIAAVAVAKGFLSIAWDFVKWCIAHPFILATIALSLYAFHLRGEVSNLETARAADQVAHAGELAQRDGRISALEASLAAEQANAQAAELANLSQATAIATLRDDLEAANKLRDAARAEARRALAELRAARESIDRAAESEAARRAQVYETDPASAAWRDAPVPGPVAARLLAAADEGPPT